MVKKNSLSPLAIADQLLSIEKRHFLYWGDSIYVFDGGCWKREINFETTLNRLLLDDTILNKYAGSSKVATIQKVFEARFFKSYDPSVLEFWLDGRNVRVLKVGNGLIDLDRLCECQTKAVLIPNTSDFFTQSAIPVSYDPKADYPTFRKILNEILPDEGIQQFLQEWVGYLLTNDLSQQKFVIFLGEGANGKSVLITVISTLLGQGNISAVPLESFNPVRTFPLAAMKSKRVNIAGEIGHAPRVAEGIIKQIVGGDPITLEEKHKPAFETIIPAKLMFCTNTLPHFSDASQGLWRRLVIVPFNVTIPEGQQDKRLVDVDFWKDSGEMPGILNWALEGLKRLRHRDHFDIPPACQRIVMEHQQDCNPLKTFLDDSYILDEDLSIGVSDLYSEYREWMSENGHNALSQPKFSREVQRIFPEAKKSENARKFGSSSARQRVWQNLGKISSA